MAVSSLGIGSGILTQDVLDQLRAADEAQFVKPLEFKLALEDDKKNALNIIDANMTNLIDSINAINSHGLYDERSTEVTGTSVEISADANSDIQDFTLTVNNLATKQIEQSGAFASIDETIANGTGSMILNIDGTDFTIDYDSTTTLNDFKNMVNEIAGAKVDATIVQISDGDFRLFVSSAETGASQDITLSDSHGMLKDTRLSVGLTAIQTGVDANFTFNGQAITRSSNEISDLITGYDITLKEVGTSTVSVMQDRESIMEKFDSFVEKYNAAMMELSKMTKQSPDSEERGIFANDSIVKGMQNSIQNMISTIGSGVGSVFDYGLDVDKDGVMTLDKDVLNDKLDEDPTNVEAFFAGGTFTNADGTTVELEGALNELAVQVESYTDYNATLDQFSNFISDDISSLEDQKADAIERLDIKYEILAKRFAAYDLMISKITSASAMFVQMANAQIAAQES